MSVFPATSLTLLQKLAVEVTGEKEAAWVRFFGLYTPAMRRFIELNDHKHDPDDVIQDVYLKLVDLLKNRKYDSDKSRFRTFIAMLIRHQLVSLYRKEQVRGGDANISLDALEGNGRAVCPHAAADASYAGRGRSPSAPLPAELSTPATQGDELDLAWARAKHEAAVEHVLTKTALSAQTKAVYRAYVLENRPLKDIEKEFGISRDVIYKVKNRIDNAISIVEEEYADENF